MFYTSVQILELVNDLECELICRADDDNLDEHFRRGNGSEFPSKSVELPCCIFERTLAGEIDCNVKFPSDVVNNLFRCFFCLGRVFREKSCDRCLI